MTSLTEAHFCGISSQSSIYGLTFLFTAESTHKVLVASSKRKVYCIEYSKNQQNIIFSIREVHFTYIPGRAEIISIDAFNQVCHVHDFVVGITFTKVILIEGISPITSFLMLIFKFSDKIQSDNTAKQSQYFNIYSYWEPSNECDLDKIAQSCLHFCLDFIPFHLTHTEPFIKGSKEMVWLLSGSDCKIHMYREDKTRQTYSEEPSDVCFPEFEDLTSVVMWMDFITTTETRLTAFGCKDGSVIVTYLNLMPEVRIQSSWKIQHDGPISFAKLFQDSVNSSSQGGDMNMDSVNLFVGNTLEVSVVYRDILKNGLDLSSQYFLPNSNKYDCATCGLIADIDMDGKNDLLLGTYGQQLLVYKWKEGTKDKKGSYTLFHQQLFPNPLLAMNYVDITGDGLKELLILTTKGLHILQHDLEKATELCIQRMKCLLQNLLNEELEKILTEDS
ncbi:KICSTOR complex protein kaptin-like isoform X2 [Stegodyphus dumicola]|nr:KICSTOR complex protein kaptin-like isoform X2 [Stegodyphus dumicola]